MKLDQNVISQLSAPINKVWNYIGYDAVEACGNDNACAIEMCIDANRLSTCVNEKAAEDLVMSLIKEHGYTKVLKFLSKNFRFV